VQEHDGEDREAAEGVDDVKALTVLGHGENIPAKKRENSTIFAGPASFLRGAGVGEMMRRRSRGRVRS